MTEDLKNGSGESNQKKMGLNRRDILKGLIGVPVLGVFAYSWLHKQKLDEAAKKSIHETISLDISNPLDGKVVSQDRQIRLGIIGTGGRGRYLLKAAGFLSPKTLKIYHEDASKNKMDKRYAEFLAQPDLNIVVNGICDIYDVNAGKGQVAAANITREYDETKVGQSPKRYKNYKELLAATDIDAVIIATPDHWHGPMTIEAARAGKHVYCEKPMTWSVAETYEVVKAVTESGIIFQLGHQNRQTESYFKAKEAIEKGFLGKVNLVEVTTNRNSPEGAWVYKIDEEANHNNIDWQQFLGPAPFHEFSLERFFRWRCWWDYSTGLSGDLFTHDYDAMNQILGLGIPHSAVASGGIYFFKDGRTVPDVLQMAFEYPDRDLTLLYSASQASEKSRGRLIMGNDAWMAIDNNLDIYADPASVRYKEKIEAGIIDPAVPIYSYNPGRKQVDAITSPTEKYFAGRGLLYTYRDGQRVDPSHLHIKDWLDGIRSNTQPMCNINRGFEEAMTAHMGTIAYRENRKTFWDKEKRVIV
jgi:predicted dehydrogenase